MPYFSMDFPQYWCENCRKLQEDLDGVKKNTMMIWSKLVEKITSTDDFLKNYQKKEAEISKKMKNFSSVVKDLNHELEEKESKMQELLQEIEPLRLRNEQLQKENMEYYDQLQKYEEKMQGAEILKQQLEVALKNKERQEEELLTANKTIKQKMHKATHKLDEVNDLKSKLNESEDIRKSIQTKLMQLTRISIIFCKTLHKNELINSKIRKRAEQYFMDSDWLSKGKENKLSPKKNNYFHTLEKENETLHQLLRINKMASELSSDEEDDKLAALQLEQLLMANSPKKSPKISPLKSPKINGSLNKNEENKSSPPNNDDLRNDADEMMMTKESSHNYDDLGNDADEMMMTKESSNNYDDLGNDANEMMMTKESSNNYDDLRNDADEMMMTKESSHNYDDLRNDADEIMMMKELSPNNNPQINNINEISPKRKKRPLKTTTNRKSKKIKLDKNINTSEVEMTYISKIFSSEIFNDMPVSPLPPSPDNPVCNDEDNLQIIDSCDTELKHPENVILHHQDSEGFTPVIEEEDFRYDLNISPMQDIDEVTENKTEELNISSTIENITLNKESLVSAAINGDDFSDTNVLRTDKICVDIDDKNDIIMDSTTIEINKEIVNSSIICSTIADDSSLSQNESNACDVTICLEKCIDKLSENNNTSVYSENCDETCSDINTSMMTVKSSKEKTLLDEPSENCKSVQSNEEKSLDSRIIIKNNIDVEPVNELSNALSSSSVLCQNIVLQNGETENHSILKHSEVSTNKEKDKACMPSDKPELLVKNGYVNDVYKNKTINNKKIMDDNKTSQTVNPLHNFDQTDNDVLDATVTHCTEDKDTVLTQMKQPSNVDSINKKESNITLLSKRVNCKNPYSKFFVKSSDQTDSIKNNIGVVSSSSSSRLGNEIQNGIPHLENDVSSLKSKIKSIESDHKYSASVIPNDKNSVTAHDTHNESKVNPKPSSFTKCEERRISRSLNIQKNSSIKAKTVKIRPVSCCNLLSATASLNAALNKAALNKAALNKATLNKAALNATNNVSSQKDKSFCQTEYRLNNNLKLNSGESECVENKIVQQEHREEKSEIVQVKLFKQNKTVQAVNEEISDHSKSHAGQNRIQKNLTAACKKSMICDKSTTSDKLNEIPLSKSKMKLSNLQKQRIKNVINFLQKSNFDSFQFLPKSSTSSSAPTLHPKEETYIKSFFNPSTELNQEFILEELFTSLKKTVFTCNNIQILGKAACCRFFTAVCRIIGDIERARIFCYDIIHQRLSSWALLIANIVITWPNVLKHSFPGSSPLLDTMQYVLTNSGLSFGLNRTTLNLLCSILSLKRKNCKYQVVLEELLNKLKENILKEDKNFIFETTKAIDLIAAVQGWEQTNDVFILQMVWPALQEWSMKQNKESQEKKDQHNGLHDDEYIAQLLRLLGSVCQICPLKKPEPVVRIIKTLQALIKMAQNEEVSWCIQEAAVETVIRLIQYETKTVEAFIEAWLPSVKSLISPHLQLLLEETKQHLSSSKCIK